MQESYGYLGLFVIVAFLFTLSMILIPVTLLFLKVIPHKPDPVKGSTFECGLETIGKTWHQYNFHYYFYALVFVALDVLVIFLYPWAVGLRELGFYGFFAALVLMAVISVAWIYAWKKRVLEWKK